MSIPITDKFKPKGAGGFPLMDAEDVQMPDGTRLSDLDLDLKIVTYDLVSMGLPTLTGGEVLQFETDTTDLTEIHATSIITRIVNIECDNIAFENVKVSFLPNSNVAIVDLFAFKAYVTLRITDGKVYIGATADKDSPPVSIDLSNFESEGKIVETFADGSTETTVMEFDADGKPTKITDGNGKVTVLTW